MKGLLILAIVLMFNGCAREYDYINPSYYEAPYRASSHDYWGPFFYYDDYYPTYRGYYGGPYPLHDYHKRPHRHHDEDIARRKEHHRNFEILKDRNVRGRFSPQHSGRQPPAGKEFYWRGQKHHWGGGKLQLKPNYTGGSPLREPRGGKRR